MGWQRWLSLDAISVQPIQNSFGWMGIPQLMVSEYSNALNVVLLARRI
jgi:hypothetical protein